MIVVLKQNDYKTFLEKVQQLKDAGIDVDDAIISKLTGKAAVYFTSVVEKLNN